MMWIESHQSLRNHPKVKKAARLAGVNEFEMIGRLHCLWWWALDYAPDGDVTKYSPEDIEAAVDWSGTPYVFYNALVDCGFNGHCGLLEKTGDAVLIHDWHMYGGKIIEGRERDAERKRNIRRTSAGHPSDGGETAMVDKIREDNNTEQNSIKDKNSAARAALPAAVQIYIDAGGKFQSGTLADGTTKRDNAIRVICETVKDDSASLDFWRRVVSEYVKQWSSKSYTVMLNEYYLQGRIPGQGKVSKSVQPLSGMLGAIARARQEPGYGN